MLLNMWDLSSLNRDQTCAPALEVWSLNHWTTKDVPKRTSLNQEAQMASSESEQGGTGVWIGLGGSGLVGADRVRG